MDILQEWFESGEELQSTGLFCHDVSEHLPALGEYQTVILVHRSVPGGAREGAKVSDCGTAKPATIHDISSI